MFLKQFRPFARKPTGYWADKNNQRKFFEDLAKTLDIKDQNDWYRVTTKQINMFGGNPVTKIHGNSLHQALACVFPEYQWDPFKFEAIQHGMQQLFNGKFLGYWNSLKNQREFFEKLSKQLNVHNESDWISITWADVRAHGGAALHKYYAKKEQDGDQETYEDNTLHQVLTNLFPGINYLPEIIHREKLVSISTITSRTS